MQLKLFQLIQKKLQHCGIQRIITYEGPEREYPYIYVNIANINLNHPIAPTIGKADLKLKIVSDYKGVKEISEISKTIISALEETSQIQFVEQHPIQAARVQEQTLIFKAILRI